MRRARAYSIIAAAAVTLVVAYWVYQRRTVVPTASLFTGEAGGCGEFMVYRFNPAGTLAVTVMLNEQEIPLREGKQSFAIEDIKRRALRVGVLQFGQPANTNSDSYFCTDAPELRPITQWKAISGKVEIINVPPRPSPKPSFRDALHPVSVRLEGVILELEGSDKRAVLDAIEIENVQVGLRAG